MRRLAVTLLALGFLASGPDAWAQPAAKTPRVVFFTEGPAPPREARASFVDEMRALGWSDGQNVAIEWLSDEGRPDRIADIATDLVARSVDVILVNSVRTLQETSRASRTIPVVMAGAATDPVGLGVVTSLARPGGNVTGLTFTGVEMQSKRLELLKEIAPQVARVASFGRTRYVNFERVNRDAPSLGIRLIPVEAEFADQYDAAFAAVARERADGLFVDSTSAASAHARRIVAFAAQRRLPAVYPYTAAVEAGGLAALGLDWAHLRRRAAAYVDKILKGTRPAELPIEQPAKFEQAVNLTTARSLGLTVPQSVLVRTDKLVQ